MLNPPSEEQDIMALVHEFADRDVRPAVRETEDFETGPIPLMIVGEGTHDIQRSVIASQLAERGGL